MPERLPLPRLAAGAILLLLPPLLSGRAAAQDCTGADGIAQAVVARLVSVEGAVLIDGRPPVGAMPRIAICPGSTLEVGRDSRVAIYLNEARTPLQLEESTRVQFQPPAEPGSGLVEMARGALYFLSEVRRTLTVRTPYVTAGVEGTEVYLRVDEPEAAAELIVLEGRVAVGPAPRNPTLEPLTATTGERVEVASDGAVARTSLPSDGTPFGALRRVTVGQLAWTLFYPDVLVGGEAQGLPRITEAARLLAAGQVAQAEAVLANVPEGSGREAGLRDALRATIAFARKDAGEAQRLADRAIALAPDAAAPRLAASYARQLALDLDGAVAAAEAAVAAAPRAPLPQARLAELRLMRGETRAARRAAAQARALGGGPLAEIVLGYAELAALRGRAAEEAFLRALAQESRNPLALLGLGLAEIKQGRLEDGTQQIESAVVHDPSSSLLRSYLGKAYFEDRRDASAGTQLAIAKDLDPSDPTPWFYDAIRKQLENRPVEALRNLERSIALNDNRAPFRSRLLLDEDAATRGVNLGRIYQDLGFERLPLIEGASALALDPASAAAHRLLADAYSTDARHELARASEVLQAQLLAAPNASPLPTRLSQTYLNIVSAGAPPTVGFGEYGALFERDGLSATLNGLLGTQTTYGEELVASVLSGPVSLSASQLFTSTDGFRRNADIENRLSGVYGKMALNESVNVQAEFRRRETDQGDIALNFDPETYLANDRRSLNQDTGHLGASIELSPNDRLLAAGFVSERVEKQRSPGDNKVALTEDGYQAEVQYVRSGRVGNARVGGGHYAYNVRREARGGPVTKFDREQTTAYGYTTLLPGRLLRFTVGLTFDDYDEEDFTFQKLSPKLGFTWTPIRAIRLRAAATRAVKRALAVEQTLEPTQVEGFPQFFDDSNGTRSERLGIGVDTKIGQGRYAGLEISTRNISQPAFSDKDANLDDFGEKLARIYFYQTLTDELSFLLSLEYDLFKADETPIPGIPKQVQATTLSTGLRYHATTGWFASLTANMVRQEVENRVNVIVAGPDVIEFPEGVSHFVSLDGSLGYRLSNRAGQIQLEARNLLGQRFDYQDDNFRISENRAASRYMPETSILLRLELNF